MSAQVLAFPRACSACAHVAIGHGDLFCLTFREPVAETDAQDCEGYQPGDA